MPEIDFNLYQTTFVVRRGLCQLSVTINNRAYAVEMSIPEDRPLSVALDAAPLFAILSECLARDG